jgi:uncharacterized protein (TIGR00304 family)
MNKYHFLSLICFIIGIVFFILGFLQGDIQTGIFLVFPFIAGSGIYAFTGFIFIFIAILLFIFGFTTTYKSDEFKIDQENSKPTKNTSVKGGGVVLIGPIPIIFGSNWKIAVFLMILAIILILVAYFAFRLI